MILLDALMPGMDGFATCRRLEADAATRDVPVIFMTGLTETEHVLEGFAVGGVDYVTKPIEPEVVLARVAAHVQSARRMLRARDAIETVGGAVVVVNAEGEHVFVLEPGPSAVPSAAMESFRLTPRELEVLGWVSKGKTNRDIGEILGMSPRTVNKHLEHIYEKLCVETRTAAAAMAMRIGGDEG